MNPLYVNKLTGYPPEEALLREGSLVTLDRVNWPEYPYKPYVTVHTGWEGTNIYLLFKVEEKSFQALVTETNGMVCNDSCVEFFFQEIEEESYYNLELNGTGTMHLKKGLQREGRTPLSEEIMNEIEIQSSLEKRIFPLSQGKKGWELLVKLPLHRLFPEKILDRGTLSSLILRGNFYKCGDELMPPHYISWAPVKTEQPDFHSPSFFREIHFRR
jgi:hypothetical protein